MIFRIPVTNSPQQFTIALAGTDYIITCKYNSEGESPCWALDIADALTSLPLASYIPLITGANLLSGLEYLGINGQMYCQTDGDQLAIPTYENLSVESFLFFVTDAANG